MTTPTLEQQVEQMQRQVTWLTAQVMSLYNRMQMPFVEMGTGPASDGRTETGMGAIVSPDKTSFL
jgi:hypothetical protein